MTDAAKENWIEHYVAPYVEEDGRKLYAFFVPAFGPKPATTETWKGETHVCPFCSATCAVGTFCTCERGQDEMRRWDTIMQAPAQSPLDQALEDFTARRKAKRESVAPSAPDDHPWARAGHTHADWSTDACPKCRLTGQEVRELGYYPKCDDYKREREERAKIARAMSTPLPHDPDIRTRLMPWRGKE